MRNIFFRLALVLIFALPLSLAAQNFFALGLQFGINTSKLSTKLSDYAPDKVNGYQVGMYLKLGANKKLCIQPELMLQTRGGDFSYKIPSNDPLTPQFSLQDAELKVRLTTLEIPVIAGLRLLHGENSNLRFILGPTFSYKIDEQVHLTANGADQSFSLPEVMYAQMTKSFLYGLSADLNNLSLSLRHCFSIQDMSVIEGFEQRSNLFLISIGYKIL
jgi:hypothetical protein